MEEFKKIEYVFWFTDSNEYNKLLQKSSKIYEKKSHLSSDFLLKIPPPFAVLIVENRFNIDGILKDLNISLGDLLQLCVKKNEKALYKLIDKSIESKKLLHEYFLQSNVSDLLTIDIDLLDVLLSFDFYIPPDITFSLQEIVDLYRNKRSSFDFLFKKGLIKRISSMVKSDDIELKQFIKLPEALLSGYLENLQLL